MKHLNPQISYFARIDFRDDRRLFGIRQPDRLMGMYLLGKTGAGKSNLMKTLMYGDLMEGRGFCLFDINGDLVKDIKRHVPKDRLDDLVYLDGGEVADDFGYNPLRSVSYNNRPLIASSILATFKQLWGQQAWGVKLEYILRNTILSLLDFGNASFDDIPTLLLDESFRFRVMQKIRNPHVKRFWEKEYPKYSKADILPVLNKVGSFLAVPQLRKILVENKEQVSLRNLMDSKKIFLVNLAKGRLGEDGAYLLGGLLLSSLSSAAFTRVDTDEHKRIPYIIYLDEFQNYTSGVIATAIAELRKFKLSFVFAHQYIHQLTPDIRSAVLGNVGTIICFTLGTDDARVMEREFYPHFQKHDFINLPHYHIYLKLLVSGKTSQAFSAKTITLDDPDMKNWYRGGG